jgi:hypothetical protein
MKKEDLYLSDTYSSLNPEWHAGDSPWKAAQITGFINETGIKFESVCEVGTGTGSVLRLLGDHFPSCSFVGYEISPYAYELASKRSSNNVVFINSELHLNSMPNDLLLCIDVFEHVEDYFSFLRYHRSAARLKIFHIPLELSVVSVLSRSLIRARRTVGHIHHFTLETALETLKDCGYDIISYKFTPAFCCSGNRSLSSLLINILRKYTFLFNPAFASRSLGGVSLLVLAK